MEEAFFGVVGLEVDDLELIVLARPKLLVSLHFAGERLFRIGFEKPRNLVGCPSQSSTKVR
ncbi:hypothetical protein D3C78_1784260 [compost metagenome]